MCLARKASRPAGAAAAGGALAADRSGADDEALTCSGVAAPWPAPAAGVGASQPVANEAGDHDETPRARRLGAEAATAGTSLASAMPAAAWSPASSVSSSAACASKPVQVGKRSRGGSSPNHSQIMNISLKSFARMMTQSRVRAGSVLVPAGIPTRFPLNTELFLTPCAQHGLGKSVLSKSVLSTWGNVSTPQAKYWYFRLKVAFTLDTEARGLLPFYANLVPGTLLRSYAIKPSLLPYPHPYAARADCRPRGAPACGPWPTARARAPPRAAAVAAVARAHGVLRRPLG